ncbi:MAG: MFS transporter [Chloroflexi bacterium]|nr:MFS transporter [Chloroflexota bacterium]
MDIASEKEATTGLTRGISLNVILLGVVSFLTDVSSEMTLTVLPLFLANVLGTTTAIIGIIEGIAETTASLTKVPAGWISDRFQRRKLPTVVGYGISAIMKPLLYLATNWGLVLAIRFSDRMGKGIRSSPRDALIADSSPPDKRGINFGFHRAADTAGAFVGLGLVALITFLSQRGALQMERATYQRLVLAATVPGIIAVLILALFVKEVAKRARAVPDAGVESEQRRRRALTGPFRIYLVIVALFTLGNSSDAFLILRGQNLGLSVLQIALLLVLFNAVYAGLATPAGAISDKIGRRSLVVGGWSAYALLYLGFAVASQAWHFWLLYTLYGVYYAAAEGVGRAWVADLVPSEVRGTAFGFYHGAVGIAALPASLIAGLLWQGLGRWHGFGPSAPFYFGAALAGLAVFLLLVWMPRARMA